MSLPRYEEYKDSGISWLGSLPSHWQVQRLKYACTVFPSNVDKHSRDDEPTVRLCNYTDVYYNEQITSTISFMEATASEDQIAKLTLKTGDTIITKDSETADDIAIAAYVPKNLPGIVCGYHLSIIRPHTGTAGAFIKRLFDSLYAKARFAVAANGLTRVGLSQYALDNIELPFPTLDEQTAIATFLDRETAKIDVLIAEQEKLIALLAEKRQATISHAVTKGLNPNVAMKDSGVAWLGEVPAHWEVVGLTKYIESVVDYRGRTPTKVDAGIFLVTAKNIRDGAIDYEASQEYIAKNEYEDVMRRGQPALGDVLFTTEAPLGQVALIDREDIALAQRVIKFRANSKYLLNQYLKSWIMGSACQFNLELLATGSTALGIKGSKIGQVRICLPPLEEQTQIVSYIDLEVSRIACLKIEADKAINLLKERRSALITAVVTGQIDVRGLIEPQPN